MQVRRSLFPLTLALSLATSALAPFAVVSEAHADDTAKIKTIFQEGIQLEAGGNFAGALSKFQEVALLKRTPNVVFHIAFCQEKLGQLVAAVGGYKITILEGGDDAKYAKAVQAAQEALAVLEKRVPSLTVKRGKGSDLAKITLDGSELGSAYIGKPQQIDPGAHSLEATAAGKIAFKEVIQIAEGENKTLEIVLKDKPEEKPKDDKPVGPVASSSATGDGNAVKLSPSKPMLPFIVMGAGAASLVASGVFFYLRSSAISDLDSKCRGSVCPESARSTSDSGKSATLLGNITLGLGVVGVGVGSVLLFTSKPSETAARPRPIDVVLQPQRNGGGASVIGTF